MHIHWANTRLRFWVLKAHVGIHQQCGSSYPEQTVTHGVTETQLISWSVFSFFSRGLCATVPVWQIAVRCERWRWCFWVGAEAEKWCVPYIIQQSSSCRGSWCSQHEVMTLTVPWHMMCLQTGRHIGCHCCVPLPSGCCLRVSRLLWVLIRSYLLQ